MYTTGSLFGNDCASKHKEETHHELQHRLP